MSALSKAKGFKKSKTGTYLSIGTTAFGALSVYKQMKAARHDHDTLSLVEAVAPAAGIVTGGGQRGAVLKRLGDDDVLLG
ncbi:hypothetical protein ACFV3O_27695 [Streptomyces albidoflavus]